MYAAPDFETALQRLPRERRFLLPALRAAQDALGHVPPAALRDIAAHLRVPLVEVEGATQGYSELWPEAPPDHVVEVCTGPGCWLAGGEALKSRLVERLSGDDTRCRVQGVECAFLCGRAPVVRVDGVPLSLPGGGIDAVEKRVRRR